MGPDAPLTEAQRERAAQLTREQLYGIDCALLRHVADDWRKVAAVISRALQQETIRSFGLPEAFYAQRVRALVEGGYLQSQGNLWYAAHSLVRLGDMLPELPSKSC